MHELGPILFDIAIDFDEPKSLNLLVEATGLTPQRLNRLSRTAKDNNVEAAARNSCIRRGMGCNGKPIPLTPDGIRNLGTGRSFALAVEIVDALGLATDPIPSVLNMKPTGRPPRVTLSSRLTGSFVEIRISGHGHPSWRVLAYWASPHHVVTCPFPRLASRQFEGHRHQP